MFRRERECLGERGRMFGRERECLEEGQGVQRRDRVFRGEMRCLERRIVGELLIIPEQEVVGR